MEHQKKEAIKILEQAEELFKADDFRGALMLACKAGRLFHSLPGLRNVLVAYHIHVVAREKRLPSGETDWHSVLRVAPSSTPEVIKKQYKIMRLLTHPDKSRSAAAEGAFKLVKQAWSCINSSLPTTSDSTTSPEPQNTTSRPRSQAPPARSGDAIPKPATRNSDGQLVCPHCQKEVGFRIAVDRPVLFKCQSCHGCTVITPENKFTDSSAFRQQENSQHSSSPWSIPNFLLCPICGTRNSYRVIDGLCHVSCKQCGTASSIKMDGASSNKSDQTGGASPLGSQTGIANCKPNGRPIFRRCKLCGSWASIRLEIEQISVHDDQQGIPATDLPN